MPYKEFKAKIEDLEKKLKEHQEEIEKLNKKTKRHKWWLAYLLWNK